MRCRIGTVAAAQIAERADLPLPQTAPLLAEIARFLEQRRGLAKLVD